jgi:hypothetical protein
MGGVVCIGVEAVGEVSALSEVRALGYTRPLQGG